MKNKSYIHPATLFFLLLVCVVICSWLGSGFGWAGVQNLLSAEGIRWLLRNVEDNFILSPALSVVCILFFGCGLFVHSGLGDALYRLVSRERKLSRKQKRALLLSGLVMGIYVNVCAFFAWGPWGIVRSVTGVLEGSPLVDGILCIISFGIGLTGMVYGFAVDNYRRDKDVFSGMAYMYATFAEYFVSLFFIVQFFEALEYSRLFPFWGIPEELTYSLYIFSCVFPFFFGKRTSLLH